MYPCNLVTWITYSILHVHCASHYCSRDLFQFCKYVAMAVLNIFIDHAKRH